MVNFLRSFFFINFFLFLSIIGVGQNFNFSQYLNTSIRNNPSQPSLIQERAVRLNYRIQGVGGQQSMNSAVLNAYYPWLATKQNGPTSTIGLMVLDDKVAPANGLSFQSVGLSLSYAFSLTKLQRLSFGLMPSYGFHKLNDAGFRTISQYSIERGYSPSMPLNEPLLNAQARFLSWNAGLSWLQLDRRGNALSSAGFALQNMNQPTEVFETFENKIPFATQAFFFTTVYEDRLFRFLPEGFFSSYGNSYQVQLGGTLKYDLRYTSVREGSLNFISRYNFLKSVIFGAQWEQPTFEVGLTTDLYVHPHSAFSQAFEISFALKQGVKGRNFNFNWNKWNKRKKNSKRAGKRKSEKRSSTPSKSKNRRENERPGKKLKEETEKTTGSPGKETLLEMKRREYDSNYSPQAQGLEPISIPEKVRLQNGKIVLGSAASNINFELGSATLTSSSEEALAKIAVFLLSNSEYKMIVTGHTDNVGSKEFNQVLSQKRADAVKEFLIRKGVGEDQVMATGAGMSQPLLPNTTEENRRMNRRVEFLLYQD